MTFIKKIFENFSNKKIRNIYAVNHGTHIGNLFVLLGEDDKNYKFLTFPGSKVEDISKKDFDFALKEGIITFVEKSPKKEFKQMKKIAKIL